MLPKYHDTFIPILQVLNDGKSIPFRELKKIVKDKYYGNLSEEETALKTKTGELIVLNRIGWGKVYLKQAKLLKQPERGMIQITEKGKLVLESGKLSLTDIMNDPDFLAHRQEKALSKELENEGITEKGASPEDLIEVGIRSIESQIKNELLEKLIETDPYYFEVVILKLLKKMGYGEFLETSKSNDGGIDGIINEDVLGLEKIYIQAKRYKENKVRELDIRNFIGAMAGDTTKGVFVTTSSFDEKAITKAREAHHTIILIDGNRLVDLMYEFGIGVQVKNVVEIKNIDEDFFEEN